ncbi:methionyl-tRNA formyltransferase [Shewanella sp.]|uniref:methionyl-tRNA formyltransferase n=1 Tax=Shewanella sp. TaxID=50422 RepID=UPI004048572B
MFRRLSLSHSIVGAVVFESSPFGKRVSRWQKLVAAFETFGFAFVGRYGLHVLWNRIFGCDVKQVVSRLGVPMIQVTGSINSENSLSMLRSIDADLFVSITGNQIFRKSLLEIPRLGTLNLHTALLPKYRGLMPSFWALKNNEKHTGVSVFFVDEGIDSGPILVQKKINIENMSQWELIRMTKFLGMEAIIEGVELIQAGDYELIPNNDQDSTYYSFPTRQDVIEFKKGGNRFF